jgi:hypothetical protein
LIAGASPSDWQMTPYLWKTLLDWVPFLIFIGLLVYVLRKMASKGGFGAQQIEYMTFVRKYCDEHLAETRRIGDALQRIAIALERSKAP